MTSDTFLITEVGFFESYNTEGATFLPRRDAWPRFRGLAGRQMVQRR